MKDTVENPRRAIDVNPDSHCGITPLAPEANIATFTQDWRILKGHKTLPMAESLAL
jgi:hypothetical protein